MRRVAMFAVCLALTLATVARAQQIDWKNVDAELGKTASLSGEVHRYGFPRSDLQVSVDGVSVRPALALGGWLAFQPAAGQAMVMGDLVLLDTEVNPVMQKLLDSGIAVTAVHNHLLRGTPPTLYMHVEGHGDPVKLAAALRSALSLSKTPLGPPVAAPTPPAPVDLDSAQLEQIMGVKGQANGGVYQFSVPRVGPIKEGGMALPAAMGTANAVNFQPTGEGRAAISGDFVVTGDEVNPLIAALRAAGIEVTAIHSHMLNEEPRLFFVHFWANDDAIRLARGVRGALDKTAIAKR